MVCFSSYALITEQATAAEDVRFFGQKAFGSVGSRERERKKKTHFKCSPTRYYLPSCSQARCSRSPETVCGSPKIICQKEFFTYAVCYMYRQSSDVHWQQQQRSDCTQQYQQQSKAKRSKQANERTNERSNVRHRRRIFMTMAQFIYRSAL